MKRYFRRIGIAFACDWANDYLDAIKKLNYTAWFVIIVSGITGFTSFSVDLDIMDFFKYRLDLSNKEAGTLFGAQGIPTLIVGLIASLLIDKLGLKVSLILGSLFACIFGMQLALSDNKFLIETVVSFGLPFASIMLSIPLSISAGRIVDSATKALCFMLQYWANKKCLDLLQFLTFYFLCSFWSVTKNHLSPRRSKIPATVVTLLEFMKETPF
jgi:hypothetical protein